MLEEDDDFAELSAHLQRIDTELKLFCLTEGFEAQTSGVGRYPRRRLNRYGDVNYFIDIQMCLDEHGRRREVFFEEVPYSVAFGVWVDIGSTRYGQVFQDPDREPFSRVVKEITSILRNALSVLTAWDRDRVVREGQRTTLPAQD